MAPDPEDTPAPLRWIFVLLGVVSVSVAAAGVVLPGLPTTIFLLLASYLFARSSPRLHSWIRESRLFKPYRRYLDRQEPMPLTALAWTVLIIWLAIAFSVHRVWDAYDATPLLVVAIGVGAIASLSVLWWGRISILRQEQPGPDD